MLVAKYCARFFRRFKVSRSGRIPINIPDNTEIKIDKNVIFVKGKLGEL